MLTDEIRYKLLKLVEADPQINQRTLAGELGMSLGKVNFCLHAVMTRVWSRPKPSKIAIFVKNGEPAY